MSTNDVRVGNSIDSGLMNSWMSNFAPQTVMEPPLFLAIENFVVEMQTVLVMEVGHPVPKAMLSVSEE
jgi:hypothetical protein